MSVARVSVCDGTGKVVFDELIRPDEGVEVMYDHLYLVAWTTELLTVTSTRGKFYMGLKDYC